MLVHGHQRWSWDEQKWHEKLRKWGIDNNADVVIFGHSHREIIDTSEKPYLVNPGSITWPRNEWMKPSYLIIETSKKKLIFKIKHLTLTKK
jgi:putative phosphoesterase